MSHYFDLGLARQDVRLDITDVYPFHGELGTAFVPSVNSLAGRSDTPTGFDANTHDDLDGDAVEEPTYRVTVPQLDGSGRQTARRWACS